VPISSTVEFFKSGADLTLLLVSCWTFHEHGRNSENVLSPSLVQRRGIHSPIVWDSQHPWTCLSVHLNHICFDYLTRLAVTLVFSVACYFIDILSTLVRRPCFYLRIFNGAIQIVLLLLLLLMPFLLFSLFLFGWVQKSNALSFQIRSRWVLAGMVFT